MYGFTLDEGRHSSFLSEIYWRILRSPISGVQGLHYSISPQTVDFPSLFLVAGTQFSYLLEILAPFSLA